VEDFELNEIEKTRKFWNANPCDGQATALDRQKYRFEKEPWLSNVLINVSKHNKNILEVGCGQGTDALFICKNKSDGSYTGIDYSEFSLDIAKQSVMELNSSLKVIPNFKWGNAEDLEFSNESFNFVYSMGVLHHTPSTENAIEQIYRVLQPGGEICVVLYRTLSPKLMIATFLRFVSKYIDLFTGKDRYIWNQLIKKKMDGSGTMLLECFGVPILKSYTKKELKTLFCKFEDLKLTPAGGIGIPFAPKMINKILSEYFSFLSTYYLITGRK
jgi:ubiquinone/menaquinone biosynthesis C-methylase UbiE